MSQPPRNLTPGGSRRRHFPLFATAGVLTVLLTTPLIAHGRWTLDGVGVGMGAGSQWGPTIVPDGAGGAIIAWRDDRGGTDYDIYAQRVDASGTVLWPSSGIPLCTAANDQVWVEMIPDGAGGAIVAWADYRNGASFDIYARRVDASGTAFWGADGVALCTAAGDQDRPAMASDGAGGAILTWRDYRSGSNFDNYVQRVDASGTVMWTANGVPLCKAAGNQIDPQIVPDGAGGAIVTWADSRNGTDYDIYARRVTASGVGQWATDGLAVCTTSSGQYNPTIDANSAGGAIIAWGSNEDIHAQWVSPSGVMKWAVDGVLLSDGPVYSTVEYFPEIISDGEGGAIATWNRYRNGIDFDVYAQRVDVSGAIRWASGGVAICTLDYGQESPKIVPDGMGGAVITWQDERIGISGWIDIFAQRVDASGYAQWTADGVALCTAVGDQRGPSIALDGAGGAIVAWADSRAWPNIYAQRVDLRYGAWGRPEPAVASVADIAGDQGGKVNANWTASSRDALNQQLITHYSVWRATDFEPGAAVRVAGAGKIGPDFDGSAYRVERSAAGDEYYWEWVGNQAALTSPRYSFSAPTRSDSTSLGDATHFFQVVAHTGNEFTFWPSNVMSGYSADNIAPASPLSLNAERVGPDVRLHWKRVMAPDLRDYAVYRAAVSGVTPETVHFLSSAADTVLIDPGAPTSELFYIVTANDVHENQSMPSNEANVGTPSGVDGAPSISTLTVLPNFPNPFSGQTAFSIGIVSASDVSIDLFDVAGRRVRRLSISGVEAGWHRLPFSGVDDDGRRLPPGVYFYRVTAGVAKVTNRLVIAR